MARVLSTTTGMPAAWATSVMARRSTRVISGLETDSSRKPRVFSVMAAAQLAGSSGSTKVTVIAEVGEGVGEQVDGAAVELVGGHQVVGALQQGQQGNGDRGLARGGGQRADAALQRRGAGLQHGDRGVAGARVGEAGLLQREELGGGGVVGELERCGVVDRHGHGSVRARGAVSGVDFGGGVLPVAGGHDRAFRGLVLGKSSGRDVRGCIELRVGAAPHVRPLCRRGARSR